MIGKIRGHGARKTWWIDGQEVSEAEFTRAFPPAEASNVQGTAGDSLVGFKLLPSDSLGVHPRQIKEARESALNKGVPTEFDSKGRPIFTSRLHRKRYCQAYGFFDRDAGYGDAQRNTSRTTVDESEVRKQYNTLLEAAEGPERGNVIQAIEAAKRRHGL